MIRKEAYRWRPGRENAEGPTILCEACQGRGGHQGVERSIATEWFKCDLCLGTGREPSDVTSRKHGEKKE